MDEGLSTGRAKLLDAERALCRARWRVSEDPWEEVPSQEMVKRCISVAGVRCVPVVLWGPDGGFQEGLVEGAARLGVSCVVLRTCPCGGYQDPRKACMCNAGRIVGHWTKEVKRAPKEALWCEVMGVPAAEVVRVQGGRHGTTTKQALEQQARAQGTGRTGGPLSADIVKLLELATKEGMVRADQWGWFTEVARDIAQLGGMECLDLSCMSEAVQYRERGLG